MARTIRDARLETRSARERLAEQHEPHWKAVSEGAHVGYRKAPRGGVWVARYWDQDRGRYRKKAIGTADDVRDPNGLDVLDFRQAQEQARAWFDEQARAVHGAAPKEPWTVGRALDAYLAWLADHRKSVVDARYKVETHIRPAVGSILLDELRASHIRQWHKELAERPAQLRTRAGKERRYRPMPSDEEARRARRATANRVLTVLRAALTHAYTQHDGVVRSDDAWRRVRPFREVDAARVRYLQLEECRRLLNACPHDFRRLVRGALLTGMRYGELCGLEVGDFSADAGALFVRTSKASKPRHVPLDDEGRGFFAMLTAGRPPKAVIFVRADGEPWGRSHQARPLAAASRIAGIEPAVSFHALRHTYASLRVMKGLPLIVVASTLGHSDTRMVEKHYGHLALNYVRERIQDTALGLGGEPTTVAPMGTSTRPRTGGSRPQRM